MEEDRQPCQLFLNPATSIVFKLQLTTTLQYDGFTIPPTKSMGVASVLFSSRVRSVHPRYVVYGKCYAFFHGFSKGKTTHVS